MLLNTIRVGPNIYMDASRACDEAMAQQALERFLSVTRPVSARHYFLATGGMDEILVNEANQQYHFKTYTALDSHL